MKSKIINNIEISQKLINKDLILHGFVSNKRRFGELTFIDLRDRSGIVQCVFEEDINVTRESVLEIEGRVVGRKNPNFKVKNGDIEIKVKSYKILSLADEQLPFLIRDDINVKEELRLKYRFLDLRRDVMKKNIILKSKLMFAIREFMNQNDFLDIETPILARSTPEGARDFLVPTRTKNNFFALPQSPQLFKQLLMISGFEKYYQIARCFRDEDSRKDRQPEFSQLDIEQSFVKVEDFQNFIEKMMQFVFAKLNIKINIPFRRLNYDDVIRDYGSDKPDLRYEYKIQNINEFCNESNFDIIKNAKNKRMLFVDSIISKKEFKILEEIALKNKANILFYFVYKDKEVVHSNFAKKVPKEIEKLIKKNDNKSGTYFIVASNYEKASQALGAVRVKLNELFNYAKDEFNFAWIVNWPMFEYDEETNKWSAAHHPFTRFNHKIEELDNLKIENIKAKAYDLVLNGYEIGGGSARIYKPKVQRKMFELIGLSKEEQKQKFGWFLEAFKYGVPPHCGIAFGLDRLVMILRNQKTIRDVIPFPKNSKAQDLLTNAPNVVEPDQLNEINLKIAK